MFKNKTDGLALYKPSVIGFENCKKAAVCIPFLETDQGIEILFQVRSRKIERQPGDICFPGGMAEPGESPRQAALRELQEELCLEKKNIEIIGASDIFYSGSIVVYPYVVILKEYEGSFSLDEVEEVFTVPLSYFLEHEPESYCVKFKADLPADFPYEKIYGGKEYRWRDRKENILFYQYENRTIWGMTARILKSFLEIYKNAGELHK